MTYFTHHTLFCAEAKCLHGVGPSLIKQTHLSHRIKIAVFLKGTRKPAGGDQPVLGQLSAPLSFCLFFLCVILML